MAKRHLRIKRIGIVDKFVAVLPKTMPSGQNCC